MVDAGGPVERPAARRALPDPDALDLPSEAATGTSTVGVLPRRADGDPDDGVLTDPTAATSDDVAQNLGSKVAQGAKWSMLGNIITRAGSLVVGIVVANLIGSAGVGVFAVAMTVGQMLLTFIDMGLGTDLVRGSDEEMERKAPTVATLGMILCSMGALVLVVGGELIARALGTPDATRLLQVYSLMVFIGGLAIVPQALLVRRLDQRHLAFALISNFVVSNAIILSLLLASDVGVLALPIGAVAGMAVEVFLFYVFSGRGLRFGWDREVLRPALGFGLPVAGSNLLQVMLSNVDKLVVAPVLGPVRLGHYTMASNVANWPVSVFGLVVRSVALPAFAHTKPAAREPILTLGSQLTWLIAFPVGLMLALFSHDVILFFYNPDFARSIPLLALLGLYGALRVMFDTWTGYLYARGNSRAVLHASIGWVVVLFASTWIAARTWGTEGAAMAQIFTVVAVALPIFLWSVHKAGGSVRDIFKSLLPATLASIPAAVVSVALSRWVDTFTLTGNLRIDSMIGLAVGGLSFLAIYLPLVYKRVRASIAAMRTPAPAEES
ncbi:MULTISPECIES: oligosaccharide flippase family protein [unclassified Luteococcus]|uniref:oligosaccharide flippase family protein n=1 Tax=unclassified Luteococcus TaxID=2639923 RepID=UPI00313C1966